MNKLVGLFLFLLTMTAYGHGISEEAKQMMIDGGYIQYIMLGANHMITGYDHLLFLFGVIFFLTKFKDVLKFVTAFTLGHSITLILATFMGITANYWLIDAVIAITVIYKGFDNNKGFQKYLGMQKAPNLILMIFLFGLIHGFGLSTRLQQLPLGFPGVEMFTRIISFNIGVELGQIAALALMIAVLSRFRNTDLFDRFSKVANDALMICGFLLLLMQLHGYLHMSHPNDYGFPEDSHQHTHDKMQESQSHDSL